MHTVRTKSFSQYGHPEFEVIIDFKRAAQEDLKHFLTHLQEAIGNGTKLSEGCFIQYGTNLLRITESDHGYLRIDEPNYKGLPIAFRPGVTESLESSFRQRAFLLAYGLPEDDLKVPSMQQGLYVSEVHKVTDPCTLARIVAKDESDSGWVMGELEKEGNEFTQWADFKRIPLYEMLCERPHLKPWLGFPVGSVIAMDDSRLEVSLEDTALALNPESPLAEAIQSSFFPTKSSKTSI
jgi:hypothetical protein